VDRLGQGRVVEAHAQIGCFLLPRRLAPGGGSFGEKLIALWCPPQNPSDFVDGSVRKVQMEISNRLCGG
jgi:hypothetical protein